MGFDESNIGLIAYFHSALADNENRRSTCGYIFLLYDSPISWATKVQCTVALSTTEAEFMASTKANKEAMFIQQVTNALFDPKLAPAELRGDNQGALALATNQVFHQRTKHIDIRQRYISEMVNANAITVQHVNTNDMLADGFTKPLNKDRHWDHAKRFGISFIELNTNTQTVMFVATGSDDSSKNLDTPAARKRRRLECDKYHNLFKSE